MNPRAQATSLIAALEQLGPHDHLCSIYESPEDHYAVAIPFIRIGLDRGEKCIYIADDGTVSDVRQAMESEGIDVDRAIASNALVLATKDQAYLEHGSFDSQNIEKVFDAFYTTKSQGMGMGLAISRSIIDDHGGQLWAVPNNGPGVTFAFALPVEIAGAT